MFNKLFAKLKTKEKSKSTNDPAQKSTNSSSLHLKSVISDLTSTRSILSKMVAVFLLLIIIPVSTIGFIATRTASENLKKSAEDSVKASTQQTSNYFDVFLNKAQDLSMQVLANTVIQDFYRKNNENTTPYDRLLLQNNATASFGSLNNSASGMDIKILFESGVTMGANSAPDDMEKVRAAEWYKKVKEANGKTVWIDYSEAMKFANRSKYALSLVRALRDANTAANIGVVMVDVGYEPIKDILSSISLGMEDTTYMLTNEGIILSAEGADAAEGLAQRQFVKDVLKYSADKPADFFYTKDNGRELLVSYSKSSDTGMTIITIVPKSVIMAGSSEIFNTTIITGIIFVLFAGAIGFIFSLSMTIAMKSIMGAMSKAEEGDLSVIVSMKRRDEIGKLVGSFNKMMDKIRELVMQNKQGAEKVAASSEKMATISSESSRISNEIAHAIVEVATGSSNQATEIETSVKNVSQLADRITKAVEKTIVMEEESETMQSLSDFGSTTIESLNNKASQTNEITLNVVKEINQLNQYVKNINVITNVLRSIADQTNLLALNAAIEAARAGDAGKGFAVVADEIRKLAEQSNSHTREIQKHIENVFKQAQSSTNLVGEAETSIKEQSEMVSHTAEVFSRINTTIAAHVENIKELGNMINDMDSFKEMVLSSMENISAVSEEVSASTQEVSASTQEQLASVEQLDDMAKQLNELAGNLLAQMERFKF